MKRLTLLLATVLFSLATRAQVPDIGGAAKAGAVSEAMADSADAGKDTANTPGEPMKRAPMFIFTGAIVIIIVAVAANRRRKKG